MLNADGSYIFLPLDSTVILYLTIGWPRKIYIMHNAKCW